MDRSIFDPSTHQTSPVAMHTHSTLTIARPPIFLVPLLAGMLLLATGCSSTHRVMEPSGGQEASRSETYGYSRVTEDVSGETVRVFLRDGREMELQNLYVGPDSTTGVRPTGAYETFPTSFLQKIKLVDRVAGFWQGAGVGLGLGLLNGMIGAASTSSDDIIGADVSFVIGLATGIPLSLVGGLLGAASGQRDVYRFPEHSPGMDSTATSTRDEIDTVQRREK